MNNISSFEEIIRLRTDARRKILDLDIDQAGNYDKLKGLLGIHILNLELLCMAREEINNPGFTEKLDMVLDALHKDIMDINRVL